MPSPDPAYALAFALPIRPRTPLCASLYRPRRGDRHVDRVQDCWELMVVQAGRLPIQEEDRRFDIGPGHALLLHPGRRHRGAGSYDTSLACICLHWFDEGSAGGDLRLALPKVARLASPERVYELCHRALALQADGGIDSLTGRVLLLQILAEVAAAGAPGGEDALIGQVRTRIDAEFHLALTPGGIARELGYDADYLNLRFRTATGRTLTEAIAERRLHAACAMLRDTAMPAAVIANRCGFADPAYFSRVFKRRIGLAPGGYRRQYRRKAVNT